MKKNIRIFFGFIFFIGAHHSIQPSELESARVEMPLLGVQKKSQPDCTYQWTKGLSVKSWFAKISPQSLVCPEGRLKQRDVDMLEAIQLHADPEKTPYFMQLQCLKSRQAQEAYQELLHDAQAPYKILHQSNFKNEITANQLWDLLTWHMMHR